MIDSLVTLSCLFLFFSPHEASKFYCTVGVCVCVYVCVYLWQISGSTVKAFLYETVWVGDDDGNQSSAFIHDAPGYVMTQM